MEKDNIFCVADGITREPIILNDVIYDCGLSIYNSKRELKFKTPDFSKNYIKPEIVEKIRLK